MTDVLVIHDTDLSAAGVSKQIIDSLVTGYRGTPTHVSVFPTMDDKLLAKIKADEWKAESARLWVSGDLTMKVLCSGGIAASALFETDKALKVSKIRSRMMLDPVGRPTVCTWSPKTVVKDKEFFRDVEFDIRKLIAQDGPTPDPDLTVEVVETVADLKKILRHLNQFPFLACDIETTGFNPVTSDLLSLGFAFDSGYVAVIPQKYCTRPEVGAFLRTYSGTFVFHNLKFDTKHLWRAFGRFNYKVLADTMLSAYCIDERPFNRYRHLSLKLMARMYFDAPDYEISMKDWLAEWATNPTTEMYDELLRYMALDCYYTAALYPILREECAEESEHLLSYHDNQLVPASLMMAQMELTGCRVNIPYLKRMKKTIEAQLVEEMEEIRVLVSEHTGREDFNPNSPKQVATVLYNAGDEQGLGLAQPKDAGRYAYKRAEGTVTTNSDTLKVLARQCAKEMPAAAKLRLADSFPSEVLGPLVLGTLITFGGLALVAYAATKNLRARTA
jgi:muconolactone delta-isomerase